MKKFRYLLSNSFIYFFSLFTITITLLILYSKVSNNEKDLGFKKAKAFDNTSDICIGNSDNISCQKFLLEEFTKKQNSILFLGNSQTGAINNFKEGDQTFITYLNQLLKLQKKDIEVKSIWLPNATIQEFEVIYEGLKQCKLNPKFLFIPVFLDDTRSESIRNELKNYSDFLCGDISSLEKIQNSTSGNLSKLNNKIRNEIKFLYKLKSLNEKFRTDIYKFRNLIFNIKPSTIRPIKIGAYTKNLKALENIINDRYNRNLKTIIYIPPLLFSNEKDKIPYKSNDYKIFKETIKKKCQLGECNYFNLENSVPNELWGFKRSTKFNKRDFELDFMHFTGKGHKILSKKFERILFKDLNQIK